MKFQTISDVHVRDNKDDRYHKLNLFLMSSLNNEVSELFLLGDIFDLMVGGQVEYLEYYQEFFDNLENLIKKNVKIHYFEGNHDFHIRRLFVKFLKRRQLNLDSIEIHNRPLLKEIDGRQFLFAHGDEIEIENNSYQIYKFFIRSFFIKFLANFIVPVKYILAIGQSASKKSRERSSSRYQTNLENDEVKDKFRRSAIKAYQKYEFDWLICGHSHVREDYTHKEFFRFVNNGYFPNERNYLLYDNGEVSFMYL